VKINGLIKTKDEYVKNHIDEIFEAANFEEILEKADKIGKKFNQLGCFKTVETMIDASKGTKNSQYYDVIFEVEESGNIGGGIHSSFGNNEGSVVIFSIIYFVFNIIYFVFKYKSLEFIY
jgi:hypothetical protein